MDREYYLRHDVDLTLLNSMRVKSVAANVAFPYSEEGVRQVFQDFKGYKIISLGEGSNSILLKERYDEKTLFVSTQFLRELKKEGNVITAQSGVTMSRLAWFACESHAAGFSFMEDIPGSVGGGIIMNAGTHSGCMNDIVIDVKYYDGEKDEFQTVSADGMFRFRKSVFSDRLGLIVSVRFNAVEGDYNEILSVMVKQKAERYTKQPRDWPSAGSVFKTPEIDGKPTNVWILMRGAELAGCQIGGAKVSEKHSGFIINSGGATGAELKQLAEHCIEKINEKYGVELEPEWKFIG